MVEEKNQFSCIGRRGKILNLHINYSLDGEQNLITVSRDEWEASLADVAAMLMAKPQIDYVQAATEELMAKDNFYDESELITGQDCFKEIKTSLDFQMDDEMEKIYLKPVHLQALIMLQNEMVWQVQKEKYQHGQDTVKAITTHLSIDGQNVSGIIRQEKNRRFKDYTNNKDDIQARYGNRHPGQIPGFDFL